MIAILAAAALLAIQLKTKQESLINAQTATRVQSLKEGVADDVHTRVAALTRMAERWAVRPAAFSWQVESQSFLRDFPDIAYLSYIDPMQGLHLVAPEAARQDIERAMAETAAALFASRELQTPRASPVVPYSHGRHVFIIYVPLFHANTFEGYLAAGLDPARLIANETPPDERTSYRLSVQDGGVPFYFAGSHEQVANHWHTRIPLQVLGTRWTLDMAPSPRGLAAMDTHLPEKTLFAAFALSLLTGALVYSLQTGNRRKRELVAEIERRKESELQLEKWAELTQKSTEAILRLAPDGIIVASNTSAAHLLGGNGRDVIGKPLRDFFDEREAGRITTALYALIHSDPSPISLETLLPAEGGAHRSVLLYISLIQGGGDNRLAGFTIVARDVTRTRLVEAALKRSELRLASVMQTANDAIIVCNEQGIIDSCNDAVERVFGRKKSELVGETVAILLPDGVNLAALRRTARATIQESESSLQRGIILEGQGRHANGRFFPTEISLSRYVADGKTLYTAIVRDITERKRDMEALREGQEKLEMAIKGAKLGLWWWNIATGETYYSESCKEQLGYAPNELGQTYETWIPLIHPEDWEQVRLDGIRYREHPEGDFHSEFRVRAKDGSYRWILTWARLYPDEHGRRVRLGGCRIDVTHIKLVEAELVKARDAAEEANRAKSVFLANMSHEIRTPLGVIIGYAEMLRRGGGGLQTEENLAAIHRNAESLLSLINDILDLSKVESGNLAVDRVRFPLLPLFDETWSALAIKAREKGLCLTFNYEWPLPETIESDAFRLRQILFNLLSNALKFTEHGEVRVESRLIGGPEQGASYIEIDVIDTGPGVPPAAHERIFSPFAQADTAVTRKYGGTGLGLSLSRRLARALGGDLLLKWSQPNRGSCFSVRIATGPLDGVRLIQAGEWREKTNAVAKHKAAETSSSHHALAGLHMLLVEDYEDNQALMKTRLQSQQARVDIANNGEEGVAMALHTPYDIVLMDLQMPVMNGYIATARLREAGYRQPIIALTANAMKGERERCLRWGFDDYLAKPVDTAALISSIKEHVKPSKPASQGNEPAAKAAAAPPGPAKPSHEATGRTAPLISPLAQDKDLLPHLRAFLGRLPKRLARLQMHIKQDDRDIAIHLAHQIKGCGGGYGYPDMTRLASWIEDGLKSGAPLSDVQRDLDELWQVLENARRGLQEAETPPALPPAHPPPSPDDERTLH